MTAPVVAVAHMPWRPWGGAGGGGGPAGGHMPYATSVLHTSLREPTGYLVVDLYEEADGYRGDVEWMSASVRAWGGNLRAEVYPFADPDEGRRVVERLLAGRAALGDAGPVDMTDATALNNHVVGFTRLPHLSADDDVVVAAALSERQATSHGALVQLRLAAPWGSLLVDYCLSEEDWWHEHRFVAELYAARGGVVEPTLHSFIDRVHETAIDRLVRQLAAT